MGLLPALISAGASIASSLIGSKTAKTNTDKTNEANKAMAEYQYSKDLEMWNRGNDYNAPTAQMDRLKAAGLNPAMVYGSGSATGNTTGQLPKYNAPTLSYNYKPAVDPMSMLQAYQDFRVTQAQLDNYKAQRENTEQETANKKITNFYLADKLSYGNISQAQKNDLMANILGWNMRGGENDVTQSNQWKGLDADLSFRQGRVRYQDAGISNLLNSSNLSRQRGIYQERSNEMFDFSYWSNMLSKFGLKIPSFRK